jgi:hypothetical protein
MGWGRRWCGLVRRFALGLVRRFALGLAVLLCSSCALAQACLPQILSIQSAKAAGLGPAPLGDTTLQWHNVTLPDHWLDRWPGYSGAVWYRIDWQRGCAHPHATPADPVALALHSMVMAGEVFVNGDLLWRDRHLAEPLSRSWNMRPCMRAPTAYGYACTAWPSRRRGWAKFAWASPRRCASGTSRPGGTSARCSP